jgi:hypothetical protein
MAYTPQLGIGSTCSIGGNAQTVRDFSISMSREAVKSSILSDIYETYTPGRITATISANIIADSTTVSALANFFQGQTTLGTTIAFSLTDDGGNNVYTGSGLLTSCSHTMTGDDVDIIAVEIQVTGSIG